jgi:hypothetical protein
MTIQTAVLIETLVRTRRGRSLGELQHFQHPGPRGGRHRGGGRAGLRLEGRDPGRVLVVHEKGADLAGRQRPEPDRGRRRRRHPAHPPRLPRSEEEYAGDPGRRRARTTRNSKSSTSPAEGDSGHQADPSALAPGRKADMGGRQRGDHHRRAPTLPHAKGEGKLLVPAINVNDSA